MNLNSLIAIISERSWSLRSHTYIHTPSNVPARDVIERNIAFLFYITFVLSTFGRFHSFPISIAIEFVILLTSALQLCHALIYARNQPRSNAEILSAFPSARVAAYISGRQQSNLFERNDCQATETRRAMTKLLCERDWAIRIICCKWKRNSNESSHRFPIRRNSGAGATSMGQSTDNNDARRGKNKNNELELTQRIIPINIVHIFVLITRTDQSQGGKTNIVLSEIYVCHHLHTIYVVAIFLSVSSLLRPRVHNESKYLESKLKRKVIVFAIIITLLWLHPHSLRI